MSRRDESGDWFGVLMADNSIGWLPKSAVHLLEYQVVSSATTADAFVRWTGYLFAYGRSLLPGHAQQLFGKPIATWACPTTGAAIMPAASTVPAL